jgi:hypothetical protein
MGERDFEGTLVLEQLAAIGRLEEFFDAIDADVERVAALMRKAKIDASTIAIVIRKIEDTDDEPSAPQPEPRSFGPNEPRPKA